MTEFKHCYREGCDRIFPAGKGRSQYKKFCGDQCRFQHRRDELKKELQALKYQLDRAQALLERAAKARVRP